jgi:hypothetical protein
MSLLRLWSGDQTLSRLRWQITLRDFLVLVAIAAAGLGIGARLHAAPDNLPEWSEPNRIPEGAIEGALTAVGLLLLFVGFRSSRGGRWLIVQVILTLAGAVMLWFAALDYSVHVDWCERCGEHTYVGSLRVYHIPVTPLQKSTHTNFTCEVANELGVPCKHEYERELRYRFWGFVYPYPAVGGICCLSSGGPTYAELRPYVHQMVREDPAMPAEFHRKAFVERDSAYVKKFYTELNARWMADGPKPFKPGR